MLTDSYTTSQKVLDDKEGLEATKILLSNDAYAVCELLEKLLRAFSMTRLP